MRGGDWTQFRGRRIAVSPETEIPSGGTAPETSRGRAAPGRGLSRPVIAGGRVSSPPAADRQDRLHVLSFDAATGKKLWERQFAATGSTTCHPKTCMAAKRQSRTANESSPCSPRATWSPSTPTETALVSLAGQRYPNITNQVGMASSPVLYKDTLLLPMENAGESFAAGVDRKTGKNRWKDRRPRDINWVTPTLRTVGDRSEVLLGSNKEVLAVDPATGRQRWRFEGEGPNSVPSCAGSAPWETVVSHYINALCPAVGSAAP